MKDSGTAGESREERITAAPLLTVVDEGGSEPAEVLTDVRDYLREQAIRLPHSDEWREALVGIAADLSQALELRAPAPGRLGQSQ